jgi:hypothetical protein
MLKESIYLQCLFGVLIFVISVGISMIITAWPQHNVIIHPEYWYEPIGPLLVGYIMIVSASNVVECYMVMKIYVILTWKSFLILFFSASLGLAIPYIFIYIVWVHALGYRHPMPFIGNCSALIASIVRPITLWFLVPSNLRVIENGFRKRLVAFMCLFPLRFIMAIFYIRICSSITTVPPGIQWGFGLLLPLVKKFNIWWTTKIAYKAAGGEEIDAKLSMICSVGCTHSFVLASILGSNITEVTAYVIMLGDFISNALSCAKIIRLHQKGASVSNEQKTESLKCLALKEYLEVLIPAVYCASFVVAFYGPNYGVLGNIGNEYWQFEKVDSLFQKLSNISIFFIIDALRGILFGLVLWYFCKLNLLDAYGCIIQRYGPLVLFYGSLCLSGVSKNIIFV